MAAEPAPLPTFDEVQAPLSVSERWDVRLRAVFGLGLISLFFLLNVAVIWIIVWLAKLDQQLIMEKNLPGDARVVTSEVVMALIGATVVQVGAAAITITKYLYRAE
jgi:hypothetical protein